tara:strand:+ start:506 stop:790 length:285 start_codon:yes stop_codon:yes gene_type:complete
MLPNGADLKSKCDFFKNTTKCFGKTQSISLNESINQNTSQGILGHLKYNFGQIKLVYEYYATGVMFSRLAMITLGFSIAKTKAFYKKVIDTNNS